MPIAQVEKNINTAAATESSITTLFPDAHQASAGNLIVAIYVTGQSLLDDPPGMFEAIEHGRNLFVWVKVAAGGETGVTIDNIQATRQVLAIAEYAPPDGKFWNLGKLFHRSIPASGSGEQLTVGPVEETTIAESLCIAAIRISGSITSSLDTWTDDFVHQGFAVAEGGGSSNHRPLGWAHKIVSANAAHQTTGSWTRSRNAIGVLLVLTPADDDDAVDVEFLEQLVGAPTSGGATVKARVRWAEAARLEVSTESDFSGSQTFAGTLGNDLVWTFLAEGLDPNTQHYWRVKADNLDSVEFTNSITGRFRTLPSGQTPFEIAFGGCAFGTSFPGGLDKTSNAPTFTRILDRLPLAFIHNGDLHYRDIGGSVITPRREAYRGVLNNARQGELYRHVPIIYNWDDHDYTGNDSGGPNASVLKAYREYVPHYLLPAAGGIYKSFVIGPMRFILLDVRYFRTNKSATDDASKTMLGTDQKAWLKSTLLAATEPIIVIDTSVPWHGEAVAGSDTWQGYATERAEISEFLEANNLTSRLIFIHGDAHAISGDDGTNSYPDLLIPGPPVWCSAGLDTNAGVKNSPWSQGDTGSSGNALHYSTMTVEYDEEDIVVTLKGWEVDSTEPYDEHEIQEVEPLVLRFSSEEAEGASGMGFEYDVAKAGKMTGVIDLENDDIRILLLKVADNGTLAQQKGRETVAAILATAAEEYADASYERKALASPDVTIQDNMALFKAGDVVWVALENPGTDEAVGAIVYQHNDADDALNIPIYFYSQDFPQTPDGRDFALRWSANILADHADKVEV